MHTPPPKVEHGKAILIVEPDDGVAKMLCRRFGERYLVTCVKDRDAALKLLSAQPKYYGLVITNLQPEEGVTEFIRTVRALDHDVRVMVFSGSTTDMPDAFLLKTDTAALELLIKFLLRDPS